MPESLEYRGGAGPEALVEDVVFSFSWVQATIMGFVAAGGFFGLAVLLYAAVATAIGWTDSSRAGIATISILSPVFGAGVLLATHRKYRGIALAVGAGGITETREGVVVRACAWGQTTVAVLGRWGKVRALANAAGQPYSLTLFASRHPDANLAKTVMKNVAKERPVFGVASGHASSDRPKPIHIAVRAGSGVVLCAMGFGLVIYGKPLVMAFDASSAPSRFAGVAAILAGACLLGFGFVLALISAGPIGEAEEPKTMWDSALAAFVIERKGRFEPVEFPDGMWFRYVDSTGLRKLETMLPLAWVSLVFSGLMSLLYASAGPSDPSRRMLILFMIPFAATPAFLIPRGVQLRRVLEARVRRVGDGYEVERVAAGEVRRCVVRCRVVREPERARTAARYLGATALVLRGEDGRVYRVDPRFLVESPGEPRCARPEPSQPPKVDGF